MNGNSGGTVRKDPELYVFSWGFLFNHILMDDKLHAMRHSAAHVLAAAVNELYPGAKFGVGPVVEDGFYYDILTAPLITEEDFGKIEQKMREIVNRGDAFRREEMPIDQAITFFTERKQDFKVDLLKALKEKGTTAIRPEEAGDLAGAETASVYYTGNFVDLCRGPHVSNAKEISAFKLAKLAGAYWRGDDKNPQLQRVYGYCFATQAELDTHLLMLEEAKKRDHRKLGKELELFTIIDEIGPGLPLFYPRGAILRRVLENYVIEMQEKRGYVPIWIPHITKGKLYEISGHLQKYDAMYPPMHLEGEEDYYLKPMNCPHFMMLYKTKPHSYRELPVRYTCTTTNYRYEKSGELSGLTRVRSLTQDDCHVFATPGQIEGEINLMLDMLGDIYKTFGFNDFWVRISTRDPADSKYIGDDNIWEETEASLTRLIKTRGWKYDIGVGEAAFYGPKLDFIFKDVIGRNWQLSTIQLDMNLPARFELEYIDTDGLKQRPIVIHRALLGSTERFLGILIEHYAGAFPMWLAPEQIRIASVSEAFNPYAQKIRDELVSAGLRVELDHSPEKLGKKIRDAALMKVPWTLVIGGKEAEGGDFKVKVFGQTEDLLIKQADFVARAVEAGKVPR